MRFPNARIVQFAKVPRAGHVKTRLIPALGENGALEIHKKLLTYIWQKLNAERVAPVQLWMDQVDTEGFFENLRPAVERARVQQGSDLGERMAIAIEEVLGESEAVIVVGSDCPVLDGAYLTRALESLQQGADVVLGPASDGGYVLIGMKRLYPGIFEDINWGSEQVLAQTRERLTISGCPWVELEECWDVDRPEDLCKLEDLNLP